MHVCLSVCMSVCLYVGPMYVCMSVCLSVCITSPVFEMEVNPTMKTPITFCTEEIDAVLEMYIFDVIILY